MQHGCGAERLTEYRANSLNVQEYSPVRFQAVNSTGYSRYVELRSDLAEIAS